MIEKIWTMAIPLTFGILASWGYLNLRSRKKKPAFLDGLVAWILFVVFAFIGELGAHTLYPSAYRGIGDNPQQIAGLMLAVLSSFFINPILFIGFRKRSMNSKEPS